jgi:hypothetical protein
MKFETRRSLSIILGLVLLVVSMVMMQYLVKLLIWWG